MTQYTSVGSTDDSYHHLSVTLTGLTAGSEYCAEFYVFGNSYLRAPGEQVAWNQHAPQAETWDAYSTGAQTATVEGEANPGGDNTTTYQVQYGPITSDWCQSEGSSGSPAETVTATDTGADPTDSGFEDVSADLSSDLTGGDAYCAQVIATSSTLEADGGLVVWTQGTPSSDTFDVSPAGVATATVDGDVNPADRSTTYAVQYDLTSSEWCTSDGASGSPAWTTPQTALSTTEIDGAFHDVSVTLSGLAMDTSYCAEVVATNSDGESEGFPVSWTQPKRYTLSLQVTGSGTVSSSPTGIDCGSGASACSATYTDGTQVTLTATPAAGYELLAPPLVGCSPSGVGKPTTCVFKIGGDLTFSFHFAPPPVPPGEYDTLYVSTDGLGRITSSPAGIDCGSTCSHLYLVGSKVTLAAMPDTNLGAKFAGWSGGDCSGTGPARSPFWPAEPRLKFRRRSRRSDRGAAFDHRRRSR